MVSQQLKKSEGFTFLELSVILFIMMILLGVALPRFPRLFESDLQLEARKMARLIYDLRQQAILNGEKHKLIIDTQKSRYSVFTSKADQPDRYSPHKQFEKPVALAVPISFSAFSKSENINEKQRFAGRKITFDKIFGQEFEIIIDASGFVDPFTVQLQDSKNRLLLSVVSIMGKTVIGEEAPL